MEYPKGAIGKFRKHTFSSVIEEKRISLKDFSVSSIKLPFNVEFPVCDGNVVGKPWQYSYFLSKEH